MKKAKHLFLALIMLLTVVFTGEARSAGDALAAPGEQEVIVRRNRKGFLRKTYAAGRRVTRKGWTGTKKAGRKSWKTGRKAVSRTKKIVY